jgi:hypothetical protein
VFSLITRGDESKQGSCEGDRATGRTSHFFSLPRVVPAPALPKIATFFITWSHDRRVGDQAPPPGGVRGSGGMAGQTVQRGPVRDCQAAIIPVTCCADERTNQMVTRAEAGLCMLPARLCT